MPTMNKKPTAKKAEPKVVDAITEVVSADAEPAESETEKVNKVEPIKVVRRKELVDRIAANSGVKPNLIKSVLDAVIQEIGDVLSAGEALQVQPLGKMTVNRRKELPDGEVIICKLRRKNPVIVPSSDVEPSSEAAE